MKQQTTKKILQETETGYNLISKKFSETRKHFWGSLDFIKKYTKNNDTVLDYGCGNGRLLELFVDKKIHYIGLDVSEKLLEFAKKKYSNVYFSFQKIESLSTTIPLNSNYFNTIYSIATFHHLPSDFLRAKIANELYRTLKPGGYLIITVWNIWQKKYWKNILQNWWKKLINKSELDWNDCRITFTNNQGNVFNRYHHAFTANELKKLFLQTGFTVEKCSHLNNNILLIAKKPQTI